LIRPAVFVNETPLSRRLPAFGSIPPRGLHPGPFLLPEFRLHQRPAASIEVQNDIEFACITSQVLAELPPLGIAMPVYESTGTTPCGRSPSATGSSISVQRDVPTLKQSPAFDRGAFGSSLAGHNHIDVVGPLADRPAGTARDPPAVTGRARHDPRGQLTARALHPAVGVHLAITLAVDVDVMGTVGNKPGTTEHDGEQHFAKQRPFLRSSPAQLRPFPTPRAVKLSRLVRAD